MLGFVKKEDVLELGKAILAAQRDHGNREIRTNARMKYLVHNLGIDGFRTLVEVLTVPSCFYIKRFTLSLLVHSNASLIVIVVEIFW
jgi:sulfite reductase beta subunit-like hemoprotein